MIHHEYQVPSRCLGVGKIVIFTIYISTHPRPTIFFEFKHDIFANPLDILEKPDILDISFVLACFCKVSPEKRVSVVCVVEMRTDTVLLQSSSLTASDQKSR